MGWIQNVEKTQSNKFFGKCNGVAGGCSEGEMTFVRADDVGGMTRVLFDHSKILYVRSI